MTGPVTAAQLLELATQAIGELHKPAAGRPPADPAAIAAGWPAFCSAGERLLSALTATGHPRPDAPLPLPPSPGKPVRPHRQLQRAADLLGAAADLLSTQDRGYLTVAQQAADARYATGLLAGAGWFVTSTLAAHPALLSTLADAAAATSSWWQAHLACGGGPGGPVSLADASTTLSPPAPGVDPADPVAVIAGALHDWQRAALAAATRPAPSRDDLRDTALTAGGLLALSQALLQAHAHPDTPKRTSGPAAVPAAAVAVTVERIRSAGRAWNTAAQQWRLLAGGDRPDPQLLHAAAALDRAVAQLARSGTGWIGPAELRTRTRPDTTLHLATGVLTAVQTVADRHAPVVAQLAATGALYTATRLPQPPSSLPAARAGHWLPVSAAHVAPLSNAYRVLPELTAGARLSLVALTSPPASAAASPLPAPAAAAPDLQSRPPVTLAVQRWQTALAALDPRLLDDPHLPALAAALDRVALTGTNIAATLAYATSRQPLPDQHPGRALHARLIDVCPAATIPLSQLPHPTPRPPARPAPELPTRRATTPHPRPPPAPSR